VAERFPLACRRRRMNSYTSGWLCMYAWSALYENSHFWRC